MDAGERSCACPHCGAVCAGRFPGCPEVWAGAAVPLTLVARTAPRSGGKSGEPPEAAVNQPVEAATNPRPHLARPEDHEQLRAELVAAVSAAVEALGHRLENEQQAQFQRLREEMDKRLADLLIVSGEPRPARNRNGKRSRGAEWPAPAIDPELEQPTLDTGDPPRDP